MLKREITFEDFDGNPGTEVHYFNLTKSELLDLETSVEGGLQNTLNKMVETNDVRAIMRFTKKIVLASYGIREGNLFRKNEKIAEDFVSSPAFDALYVEVVSDPNAMAEFIKGMLPTDLVNQLNEYEASQPPAFPPPPTEPHPAL